tara:strand:- start:471 stop:665 length:195 start_codon:yes stop_codon:yes gene_type:complete
MLSCTPINLNGGYMKSINSALDDVKNHYGIKKISKVKVKFEKTTTLEFMSDGNQYVVVIYKLDR